MSYPISSKLALSEESCSHRYYIYTASRSVIMTLAHVRQDKIK